jgi:hypothetical protein
MDVLFPLVKNALRGQSLGGKSNGLRLGHESVCLLGGMQELAHAVPPFYNER